MSTGKPAPAPRAKSTSTNMAVSAKPPSNCKGQSASSKESKLHRRSRTGCFTCRLRRKKCEEGKPVCRACRHLGLQCEYKRPMWWSNNDQRRAQKEAIKNIIKHTKLQEKTQTALPLPGNSPPSLCHSMSDGIPRTRGGSMDSQFSGDFNFNSLPAHHDYEFPIISEHAILSDPSMFADASVLHDPSLLADPSSLMPLTSHSTFPTLGPITAYEVDVRTEKQLFVNDVELQRDSTTSTLTAYPVPTSGSEDPQFPTESWVQQHYFDHEQQTFDSPIDICEPTSTHPEVYNNLPLPSAGVHAVACANAATGIAGSITTTHPPTTGLCEQSRILVEDRDQYLLNHFLENLLRFTFPVLEVNKPGSTRSGIILPAMETNRPLLHCCLSTAGMHLQSSKSLAKPKSLDEDVQRHQHMTISTLTQALGNEPDDPQLLQAALGQIYLDSFAGPPATQPALKLPWKEHFNVTLDIIKRQNLHFQLRFNAPPPSHSSGAATATLPSPDPSPVSPTASRLSFDMALTAWIDILGGAMRGFGSPVFADIYREKLDAGCSIGLSELMGCDDRVMFLISEIACLEGAKAAGQLDDIWTCMFIKRVGDGINATEPAPGTRLEPARSATGAIRPATLTANITALFRIAARIYLCFCLPDFDPRMPNIANLVGSFVDAWDMLPGGADGFDRCVAWPLLIAGSVAGAESRFRGKLRERRDMLGGESSVGSFGRVGELLEEVWRGVDAGERVQWGDVMKRMEWDFLLI